MEKKGHMGDFYRNLLQNNVAFGTGRCVSSGTRGFEKGVCSQDLILSIACSPFDRKDEDARLSQAVAEASADKVVEAGDGPATENPDNVERAAHKRAGSSGQEPDGASRLHEPAREMGAGASHAASSGPRLEERIRAVAHEPEEVEVGDAVQEPLKMSRADAVAAARERYLARKRKAVER